MTDEYDDDDEETEHPQVWIEYEQMSADVDEGIADLILEMWRAGIDTIMSCQDNPPGRVWLDLPVSDVVDFLEIAAGDYDTDVESIFNRSVCWEDADDWRQFRAQRAWQYKAIPGCYSGPGEVPLITVDISIRFPHSDYEEVLRRFRSHNA